LKDIYIRTITGVFFLVAVIGSVILHPLAFFGLMFVFTFFGLNEFILLSDTGDSRKNNAAFYIFGLLVYALIGLIGLGYVDIVLSYLLLLVFPVTIILELFRSEKPSWKRIGIYYTGWLYVGVPFGLMCTLYLTPASETYFNGILIGLFAIIWSSDVFAYLTGSMIGKHKLFERLSPKKTWEGSIGGLVFALAAAYLLSLFYSQLTLAEWMVLAVIIVVTGTLGDLSESFLKRQAGVKDSGNLFPGHGGMLDRFDAALFATPFVFVYVNLI
jgi:phosphatidate cytidylyltransferase